MKKWTFFIVALLWISLPAYSKDLQLKKKAGKYEVEIKIDKNPPILGDNNLEIEIKDASGASITDAKVLVNYYMPPMPRMAPMNYSTTAVLKGDTYRATMDIIMSGPWIIRIIIHRPAGRTTAKFNVDAQ